MIPALEGCYAKIDRANKQIEHLKVAMQKHFDDNPTGYRQQYDQQSGVLSYFFIDPVPLPKEFSILIGEILYQVRSGLDHLIWQLVIKNQQPHPSKSGFPIFTNSVGYGNRKDSMIKGVSASAEARIESFQPFHRGGNAETDHLWQLQELNNTDKHRLLIIGNLVAAMHEEAFSFSPGFIHDESFNMKWFIKAPIEIGSVFLQVRTKTTECDLQANLSAHIVVKEIGPAKNEPIVPLLSQLSSHVSDIIKSFGPEFT